MHFAIVNGENEKLTKLKEDDRVLSQYLLEHQTKQSVFEWIRDFKDYEIREGLQGRIKELVKLIELRDGEIMELQLRLDDIPTNNGNSSLKRVL
jgi:hypothetical protein